MLHTEKSAKDSASGGVNSRLTLQLDRDQKPFRILFVCTGNACRSPMAEAIARHYGMGRVEVFSVGVAPATLDRRAVLAMAEMGIDISIHVPKGVGAVAIGEMDLIVTLCDYAQRLFPSGSPTQHRLHWSIRDPYQLWVPSTSVWVPAGEGTSAFVIATVSRMPIRRQWGCLPMLDVTAR